MNGELNHIPIQPWGIKIFGRKEKSMKEQVIKFENILNESEKIISELEAVLDRLESNEGAYWELKEYYGSEEYLKDVDISDNTKEYDDIACGVLSEDGVYNLITDTHWASIRMLELATRLLKFY